MASYDTETLYISEIYMSGVLMQIAADSLAEVVALTGDASLLEPFFEQISKNDWSDLVVARGKLGNPMRMKLAEGLMRGRLKEVTDTLRKYAKAAEARASLPKN